MPRGPVFSVSVVLFPVIVVSWLAACGDNAPPAPPAAAPSPLMTDVTAAMGIDFVHDAGARGEYCYPEAIGPGAAWLDYDGDDDLDLYLVQGGRMPGVPYGTIGTNRLYRNDGDSFVDVTVEAGVGDEGFGQGAISADYDNDGDADLFVTNLGRNVLYRNDGGTFTNVTDVAGISTDELFSLGAVFVDLDLDGWLDLYVTNYVVWSYGTDPTCYTPQDYCDPGRYHGEYDRLYRNLGDGRFADVSESSGIGALARRGMGVVAADFDGNGWPDLYVANDGQVNTLWMNQGNMRFVDEAALRGCGVSRSGAAEASMGLACADIDEDGDFDLYCTHVHRETNTFYRNDGGFFTDETVRANLGRWNYVEAGWGVSFFDVGNDGRCDVLVVNGAVLRPLRPENPQSPYAQRNHLALRADGLRFEDATEAAGPALEPVEMSRGAAFADFDRDGQVDVLVANNRGPARLLRTTAPAPGHWISIRARGVQDNRDGIGTVLRLPGPQRDQIRLVAPHHSYLSSNDPAVHFGLGAASEPCTIVARWPNGRVERFDGLAVDRAHVIVQGQGQPVGADAPP